MATRATKPPASRRSQSTAENIKETLESIVVAFVLAFVFRAFIVEAFVIPTGSMAPTLYGKQVTNTCSTCGFEYACGITEGDSLTAIRNSTYAITLRCPNCNMLVDDVSWNQIVRPDSGDRILVHKWPFDIGGKLLGPKRWDVTVFKDPRDGETNFIKRLVGLPGEFLEIIDGDIYAVSLDVLRAKEPGLVEAFDQLRSDVYRFRQSPENQDDKCRLLLTRYAELNKRLLPYLRIQRKGREAQESLWFIVYNHDYLPNYDRLAASDSEVRVGWEPVNTLASQAWDTAQREVTFASDGDEPLAIRFTGKPIDDYCAYNYRARMNQSGPVGYPVGDLRLRLTWFPDQGAGSMGLRMNRDQDTFVATLHVDGRVRIDRYQRRLPGGREKVAQRKLPPFELGRAVKIEFINVDYRVSLAVDDEEVLASTDVQYSHNLAEALEGRVNEQYAAVTTTVQIEAQGLRCRLRHLVLERDEYYRACSQNEYYRADPSNEYNGRKPSTNTNVRQDNPYHDWPGWGTWGCPIMLRETPTREYFMLGDNSPASKDSRLWWEIGPHLDHLGEAYQIGTVPEDQLLGKAFFVYWPAGYRPLWSPGIGLVPNVGRMRWIR